MRKTLVLSILMAAGAVAAPTWLCRVELDRFQDAADVAATGAKVVMCLDGYCLAQVDAPAIEQLDHVGLAFELLDAQPREKSYVYVMPVPGFDRATLARYGRVLCEDPDGVVLATDEDGIGRLNGLPVELAGVGNEPMPLGGRGAEPAPLSVPDSLIRELVGRVSPDTLEAQLVRMREFRTRYSTTDSCRSAVEWFRQRLAGLGCDSAYLDTFRADYAPTAIGVKRGTLCPDEVFVVCGHVDATSQTQPMTNTPGSDDNASGAGAALELARVVHDMSFQKTVWFIGFSGEEQGLVGSDSFARNASERGDSILLAINFDMISYGRLGLDTIRVVHHPSSSPGSQMADFFIAQADTFTELKTRKYADAVARSDHASFWKYDFNAIRGGYNDRTPMYHTIGDTIGPLHYADCGTNNIPMYAEVVKALVATMAKLAGAEPTSAVEETPGTVARVPGGPTIMHSPELARYQGRVFDIQGRDVSDRRESLAPGVYLLRPAGAGGRSSARKVVIQH